jgi:hypothetical protein
VVTVVGQPIGALLMLPVIVWQGWETLAEAREHRDEDEGHRGDSVHSGVRFPDVGGVAGG